MIVNMSDGATEEQINHIIDRIREAGYQPHVTRGTERTIVAAVGSGRRHEIEALQVAPGVDNVVAIAQPFKLVSKQVKPQRSVVTVGGVPIGGQDVVVIAGPCSVESREQLLSTAHAVKKAGASMLQGGARNMQNFALLRKLATIRKPVLLKRGPSATVKEWLLAAEYLLAGGNSEVVLCERGIKTFETETRNTMDLAAVALARDLSHLPVVADPSHGTGKQSLIAAVSRAAVAVGADGLIIEVHPCPERALSDGPQSLDFAAFEKVMRGLSDPLRGIANGNG